MTEPTTYTDPKNFILGHSEPRIVYVERKPAANTNHVFHLLMTVLTFGLWAPIWFLDAASNNATNGLQGFMTPERVARLDAAAERRKVRNAAQWAWIGRKLSRKDK